jgi:CRP/FNR family transcriptional regulator, dissimilatory nitrate respiration regulator
VVKPFSLAEYLSTLTYFRGIGPQTVSLLVEQSTRRQFEAGEIIFLEGESSVGLWLIETGRVKIYKMNAEGMEHVMHILGDGNTFNDIAALDGGNNPATAAALSDLTVRLLPHVALRTAIQHDHALAFNVITFLSTRVRGLVQKIEDLALYSVSVRLARFLLHQAENESLSGPGVTRVTIAAHLGTTPQTISTTLRELEATGSIRFNRHEILIVDEPLLRKIAML